MLADRGGQRRAGADEHRTGRVWYEGSQHFDGVDADIIWQVA
jgi:hypothetical protein